MTDSTLWQKLTSEDNLYSAWLKVAGNMSAGGMDRVSIEDFQLNLKMPALHPAVATPKMPEPSRQEVASIFQPEPKQEVIPHEETANVLVKEYIRL